MLPDSQIWVHSRLFWSGQGCCHARPSEEWHQERKRHRQTLCELMHVFRKSILNSAFNDVQLDSNTVYIAIWKPSIGPFVHGKAEPNKNCRSPSELAAACYCDFKLNCNLTQLYSAWLRNGYGSFPFAMAEPRTEEAFHETTLSSLSNGKNPVTGLKPEQLCKRF